MSLKRRFLILTLVLLALAAGLQGFIEFQRRQIKDTRHRLQEDWREMRLVIELLSGVSTLHNQLDEHGRNADFPALLANLDRLDERSLKLQSLAGRGLAGIPPEQAELDAVRDFRASLDNWRLLLADARAGAHDEREILRRGDILNSDSTDALFFFCAGSLAEMDHALESLNRTEERFQATTRGLNLGLAALVLLAWAGFSLWLLRPIAQLQTMVRRLRARDFDLGAFRTGPAEIGELLQSFTDMARVMHSFTRDLERKVAERTAELEASRGRLRQMLDDLPDAVALVNARSEVLTANAAWSTLFGTSRRSPVPALLAAGAGPEGYPVWTDHTGARRLLAVQRRTLAGDTAEDPTVILEHIRDMTEYLGTQAALASSQKLASIGRLSAGLAHEINNPLTAIAACAEGLLKRTRAGLRDDATFDEYLRTIHDEVFRCKEITEKLLDFSRHKEPAIQPCHLATLASDVARLAGPLAARAGVSIRIDDAPDVQTFSDADAIRQILLNLVLNAIEACAEGGSVRLAIVAADSEVHLRVEDNGAGVEPADLPKLFEPFFSRRGDGSGTGLGLFVCQGLAQALGGTITAQSGGPGRGASFILRLPLREHTTAPEPAAAGAAHA